MSRATCQLLPARVLGHHRLLGACHDFGSAVEIRKPHILELGLDQDVLRPQQGQVALFVLANQDVQHPIGHRQGVGRILRLCSRRLLRQVRRDQHIGPFLQGHLDRQVGHQASIDIGFAVDFHRGKDGGCGHAGADGQVQRAVVKHLLLTVAEACRHRPERNLEVIERQPCRHMRGQLLQQGQKALPITHATRKAERPVAHTKLQLDRVLPLVGPGALGQFQPVNLVQCDLGRVETADHAFDLVNRQPTGVQPANHRAHAGAHNAGNRHLVPFQPPQHAQMRKPLGSAPGQHHHHTGCGGRRTDRQAAPPQGCNTTQRAPKRKETERIHAKVRKDRNAWILGKRCMPAPRPQAAPKAPGLRAIIAVFAGNPPSAKY